MTDVDKTMITEKQIVPMFLQSFPSFKPDEENLDLAYVVLSNFARYALDLHRASDSKGLHEIGAFIERLHLEGDPYVREAATIGALEGIQNIWGNSGVDPAQFIPYLLPESKKWWDSLNRFWNQKISHVGADIKK